MNYCKKSLFLHVYGQKIEKVALSRTCLQFYLSYEPLNVTVAPLVVSEKCLHFCNFFIAIGGHIEIQDGRRRQKKIILSC